MPPVPTSAIRSGTASQARRSAAPNAQARLSGVSGGPWQLMLTGMTGQVEARRQEVQRHHDAVVELPLLREGDVDVVHRLGDEAAREIGVARNAGSLDAEPARVLDRSVVLVGHADRIRRHVVHEEVREVLGGDDDQGVRLGFAHRLAEASQLRVQCVLERRVGEMGAAGDSRCVAAGGGEDEAHCDGSDGVIR
jgi:hypothetical protein